MCAASILLGLQKQLVIICKKLDPSRCEKQLQEDAKDFVDKTRVETKGKQKTGSQNSRPIAFSVGMLDIQQNAQNQKQND